MAINVYYDKDCDLSIIQGKKVSIIGYGSQGRAIARNLTDSGFPVVVGLRGRSGSRARAIRDGIRTVLSIKEAVQAGDIICFLLPCPCSCFFSRPRPSPNRRATCCWRPVPATSRRSIYPSWNCAPGRARPVAASASASSRASTGTTPLARIPRNIKKLRKTEQITSCGYATC